MWKRLKRKLTQLPHYESKPPLYVPTLSLTYAKVKITIVNGIHYVSAYRERVNDVDELIAIPRVGIVDALTMAQLEPVHIIALVPDITDTKAVLRWRIDLL